MHSTSVSILELVILFGAAALVATIFRYLKMPTLVGLILTGLLIGPGGLELVPNLSSASFLTELGTILLMFTIGLEISLKTLRRLLKAFLGVGSIQVLVTLILVAVIFSTQARWDMYSAIFLGCLVSLSSTALILKLLEDNRALQTNHGNCLVGVLIFQDIAVIPMMLALPILAAASPITNIGSPEVLTILGLKAVAGLLFIWSGSKFILPIIFESVLRTRSREIFYFCVLFLIFGIGYITEKLGFSLSLGAFLAGFMISESAYGKQALSEVLSLRDNFLGLFFLTIGMMIDPNFIINNPFTVLTLSVSLIFIKASIAYLGARIMKYNHAVSVVVALTLAHVGEFSFILADAGRNLGLLGDNHFQYFLSTSMLTLMAAPWLHKFSPILSESNKFTRLINIHSSDVELKANKEATALNNQKPHTIVIGYGVAGENLTSALKELDMPYSVIDMNYTAVKKQKSKSIFFGDASQPEILHSAGIDKAQMVVLTVSSIEMTQRILSTIKRIRPDIHCVVRVQYLLDLEKIRPSSSVDVVVAEFETTLEILSRALQQYGVPSQKLHSFLQKTRTQTKSQKYQISNSLRQGLDLPAWEAVSTMRPFKVQSDSPVVAQSLGEINLRSITGASIVAIYREGVGSQIPGPSYTFEASDILHVIGSAQSLEKVEQLLEPT